MKRYHYNEMRFYDGEVECQLDPLETKKAGHEVYLIPADTADKKPVLIDGCKPRWNDEAWEQYPDDKVVYGYTRNADGTINYYGENHLVDELRKINKGVELLIAEEKPVSVDGVYWLSADDPAYIAAKKEADKAAAVDSLTVEYQQGKASLCEAYTTASIQGDSETAQSVTADMADLDAWFDEEYQKIEGSAE